MSMNEEYGPLAGLIGKWEGDKGMDVAPDSEGMERNPYYETLIFQPIGGVTNAGAQQLMALHYRQIVRRKADDQIFHDETGYWMWDSHANLVMHSLVIPRGVAVLAGGPYQSSSEEPGLMVLEVSAKEGDPSWGILQSPFMLEKARTVEFRHNVTVGHGRLVYAETTMIDIYGKRFEHTDQNELTLMPG